MAFQSKGPLNRASANAILLCTVLKSQRGGMNKYKIFIFIVDYINLLVKDSDR
jgi:hypothetical protein